MLKKLKPVPVVLVVLLGGVFPAQSGEIEHPPYPERGLKGTVTKDRLPVPEHPLLQHGAKVWDGTCRVCHGSGLAGAPKITSTRFWNKRIAKGIDVLINHATNGFLSPLGGNMPARGGNLDLSDKDVEAAVRYMVFNSGGQEEALKNLR